MLGFDISNLIQITSWYSSQMKTPLDNENFTLLLQQQVSIVGAWPESEW